MTSPDSQGVRPQGPPDARQTRVWAFLRRRLRWIVGTLALAVFFLEFGFAVGAVTEVGCTWCHAPRSASAQVAPAHEPMSCLDCHRDPGLEGVVRLNIRAGENFVTWLLRRDAAVGVSRPAPEVRCLACHDRLAEEVVVGENVRMSHAEVADVACVRCHLEHRDPSASAGLADPHRSCGSCHDGTVASSECLTCHLREPDAPGAPSSTGAVAHSAGWETGHGMGDLESCSDCHSPESCRRCHEVSLPHDWRTFLYAHGDEARVAGEAACLACHEKTLCDSCHVIPMPHPSTFLPDHPEAAGALGGEVCGTCHLRSGCERCHLRHIHPGIPQDLLDRLKALEGVGP